MVLPAFSSSSSRSSSRNQHISIEINDGRDVELSEIPSEWIKSENYARTESTQMNVEDPTETEITEKSEIESPRSEGENENELSEAT